MKSPTSYLNLEQMALISFLVVQLSSAGRSSGIDNNGNIYDRQDTMGGIWNFCLMFKRFIALS